MKKYLLILLGLMCLLSLPALRAEESSSPLPRLEGIMMDKSHPKDSMAILDGQLVRQGDQHHGYQILEILPNQVKVLNTQTQGQEILKYRPPSSVPVQKETSLTSGTVLPPASPPKEARSKNFMDMLNPAKWTHKIYETKATLDIARIYNAAINFYNQKQRLAKDTQELVAANYLPQSFEQPIRSDYAFYLNPVIQPFGVHADPVKKDSGMRYFFVGQDAVIRVEEGKPADEKSPPHDY